MEKIRPTAVAGTFYPSEAVELRRAVESYLAEAPARPRPGMVGPKAVIAPHAGYVYSGPVAGSAFAAFAAEADFIERIVLLGPAHRVRFQGLALPGAEAFATPLGAVPVDLELAARVAGLPQVELNDPAHAPEHSLEVELPFLQVLLGEFTVLPLAVGDATTEDVAEVLDTVWGGRETRIVISSDLSHYLPYDRALAVDALTAEEIVALRMPLHGQQACGAEGINGLLRVAADKGLEASLLDLRNSGDTAGDRRQVVGYAAIAFDEPW